MKRSPRVLGTLLCIALLVGCGESRSSEDGGVAGSGPGGAGGMAAGGVAAGTSCDPPRFADDRLRQALQAATGDELSQASLSKLGALSVTQAGVTTLSGLECATQLRDLDLTGNAIEDLGPLARLSRLEKLVLSGNPLRDLGPLSGLPALKGLSVSDTLVTELTPLSELPALQSLMLARTQVSSFEPLAAIASLRVLWAPGVPATSLAPLVGKRLTSLNLARVPLADLEPLGSFPELVNLDISETEATSLGMLDGFSALAELAASGNAIERVDTLATLPALTVVKLGRNRITELDVLTEAPWTPGLELDLTGNPLSEHALNVVVPALCERGVKITTDRVACGLNP